MLPSVSVVNPFEVMWIVNVTAAWLFNPFQGRLHFQPYIMQYDARWQTMH